MNPKQIEEILEALKESSARYFKIESSKKMIEIIKGETPIVTTYAPETKESEQDSETTPQEVQDDTFDLASPYIGFFQRGEKPGGKPLIKLREVVEKGKIVAYIRSMNLQYEVAADQDGKIVEVLVEDGQAVEYGQPLFRLKS